MKNYFFYFSEERGKFRTRSLVLEGKKQEMSFPLYSSSRPSIFLVPFLPSGAPAFEEFS